MKTILSYLASTAIIFFLGGLIFKLLFSLIFNVILELNDVDITYMQSCVCAFTIYIFNLIVMPAAQVVNIGGDNNE